MTTAAQELLYCNAQHFCRQAMLGREDYCALNRKRTELDSQLLHSLSTQQHALFLHYTDLDSFLNEFHLEYYPLFGLQTGLSLGMTNIIPDPWNHTK